jgi:hypothetical protein
MGAYLAREQAARAAAPSTAAAATPLPPVEVKEPSKNHYLYLRIPGTSGKITITWMGKCSDLFGAHRDVVMIRDQWRHTPTSIRPTTSWKVLGKPDDISAGKGVKVRLVDIHPIGLRQSLVDYHKKWYCHEPGEAEECKLGPQFHITVNAPLSEDTIGTLPEQINIDLVSDLVLK